MPEFPLVESEIVALAKMMHSGYVDSPADFPGADAAGLEAELTGFLDVAGDYQLKQAEAAIAAKAKLARLRRLKAFMRTQLKQSEADTAAHPLTLGRLGWGPRAKRKAVHPPGEPLRVAISVDENSAVHLSWRNPPRSTGGRAKTYIVERHEASPNGFFGPWHLVACVFEKHSVLKQEPHGQRLEYRIIAANHGGQGTPSASVAAVL